MFSSSLLLVFVVMYLISVIKILKEYERAVIYRFGRVLSKPKGPGIILVFYPIDQMERISLRVQVLDVPPQDIITKDNVSLKVNAVVYFKVMDPTKAAIEVEDYFFATSQMAQTTLRSVIGQFDLDEVLSRREKINEQLQGILDDQTDPWGIKITGVEVKHVDLPQDMVRAIARQAEAERERRAKVISAEGEQQAAEKLVEAATKMGDHPMAMQMRYLQTLVEISSDKNSTTIFPIPLDLLSAFTGKNKS
jgi:regulator of protease activity HflC (stomatin/prohibitin superfamily)